MTHDTDRRDYARLCDEFGIPKEVLRAVSENTADMMPMPEGFDGLHLGSSPIEGVGMFASRPFAAGELLAPARIGTRRTPAGRYTNHAANPNAKFVRLENDDLNMVAIRDIAAGEEVTMNYRQAAAVNWEATDALLTSLQLFPVLASR